MKFILISFITGYQRIISPLMKQVLGIKDMCRYSPTCSEYAKQVIIQYGAFKGTHLAVRRLLTCQPFSKSYGNI